MDEDTISVSDTNELKGRIKDLYQECKDAFLNMVGSQKFSGVMLRPLLMSIVKAVQKFSNSLEEKLDGSEKKLIALEIVKHILVDLRQHGNLTQEGYEILVLSLDCCGDALIDGIKALYKLTIQGIKKVKDKVSKSCLK